jgi:hypothetical protein
VYFSAYDKWTILQKRKEKVEQQKVVAVKVVAVLVVVAAVSWS